MSRILHIGPTEWDRVIADNSQEYPGRDFDLVRHNYTTMHCENKLMGNLHLTEEIQLAKLRAELGERFTRLIPINLDLLQMMGVLMMIS